MDINLLVNLTSRAWSLNILAALHTGTPGRQAAMLSATGAGRTAFAASLQHLIEIRLIERNPGHGHPLRPEFRLTPMGTQCAAQAADIVTQSQDAPLLRRRWTLPILAVAQSPRRFSEIKQGLGQITDRALSQSLLQLEHQTWLRRDIITAERQPFPVYAAANEGLHISRTLGLSA